MLQHDPDRAAPAWLTAGGTEDEVLGLLKTGKEAEVFIVERRTLDGEHAELLAHKRYRPTKVATRASSRRSASPAAAPSPTTRMYHEGRKFRYSRDQRAVERMTDLGKKLLAERWPGQELDTLQRRHDAGVTVPYPVEFTGDGLLMQLIGDDGVRRAPPGERAPRRPTSCAAPTSSSSRSSRALTRAGLVHADLSPYNVLWWRDRLWLIDFPQAVDLLKNPHGFDLLHHDVMTMCTWFARQGVDCRRRGPVRRAARGGLLMVRIEPASRAWLDALLGRGPGRRGRRARLLDDDAGEVVGLRARLRSMPSRTPTTIVATAQFRYHFLSAGIDVPGRVLGGRALDGLLEGLLVVVPLLAGVEVAEAELPVLVRARRGGPAAARFCSSLEMWRNTFTIVVPSSASSCSKSLMWS